MQINNDKSNLIINRINNNIMKNLKVLLALSMSILLFSCKKDKAPPHALAGEWELRQSVNGQSGDQTSYPPGNGKILKFTAIDYEIVEVGETIKKGTYSIVRYVSYLTKKEETKIVYDGQTDVISSYFIIDGNTLSIHVDANDGPASTYTRIHKF
jgi:hypothetical protein